MSKDIKLSQQAAGSSKRISLGRQGAASGSNKKITLPQQGGTIVPDGTIAPLWIIAGQSNAQGEAAPFDLYAPHRNADVIATEQMWTESTGTFQKLQIGLNGGGANSYTQKCGPEMAMMRTLADANPGQNIYCVKYAVGATPLHSTGTTNTWYPSQSGGLLDQLLSKVQAAITYLQSLGKTVQLKGLLWAQGETDSWDSIDTATYQTNLQALYNKVNTTLGLSNLPIVVYQIHVNGQGANTAQKAAIRTAQSNFVAANSKAHLINCDGFILRDLYHLDVDGYAYLGRLAAQYLPINGYAAPTVVSHGAPATAPFYMLVDDSAKTIDWPLVTGFNNPSDYEVSYDAGLTFQTITQKPVPVADTARSYWPFTIQLRVKQGTTWDSSDYVDNLVTITRADASNINFGNDYMEEISQNDYYGQPLSTSKIPLIGNFVGGAVKFFVPAGNTNIDNLVAFQSGFNTGVTNYRFNLGGGHVSCETNNAGTWTSGYGESITTNCWYRLRQEKWTNNVLWEKSTNGTTWTTMFSTAGGGNWFVFIGNQIGNSTFYDVQMDYSNVDTSLLAYYPFVIVGNATDYRAQTFFDLSGNNKHIITSQPNLDQNTNSQQYFGQSGGVNQGSAYAGWSASASGFTFTGWVNLQNSGDAMILSKGAEYRLQYDNSTGQVTFVVSTSGDFTTSTSVSKAMTKSAWHFVAVTWSAANGLRISVDNSTMATTALASMPSQKNTLFQLSEAYGKPPINGNIANFRLFSRELTASEITTLYNGGTSI